MKNMLFITRKYPPEAGGMENMCYSLAQELSHYVTLKVMALGRKQKNLIWFFPLSIVYTVLFAHKYESLLIGDGLMCFVGVVARLFAPKTKRIVIMHGLDLVYDNWLYQCYLRWFLKASADKFVCVSQATKETLANLGIDNSIVIPNGIDVTNFEKNREEFNLTFRSKNQLTDDCLIMVTVGRLVKRKGVAWFIRNVMPELKRKNVRYYIVGEGEEQRNIVNTIQEIGLEEKVKLLGKISDQELNFLYASADIFIMPNIKLKNDMEGFGIVAIEASLAGLIVIASGIEGIPDAIIDGKNGHLVESENADDFIELIVSVKSNSV